MLKVRVPSRLLRQVQPPPSAPSKASDSLNYSRPSILADLSALNHPEVSEANTASRLPELQSQLEAIISAGLEPRNDELSLSEQLDKVVDWAVTSSKAPPHCAFTGESSAQTSSGAVRKYVTDLLTEMGCDVRVEPATVLSDDAVLPGKVPASERNDATDATATKEAEEGMDEAAELRQHKQMLPPTPHPYPTHPTSADQPHHHPTPFVSDAEPAVSHDTSNVDDCDAGVPQISRQSEILHRDEPLHPKKRSDQ
jgi:hypothetical protein